MMWSSIVHSEITGNYAIGSSLLEISQYGKVQKSFDHQVYFGRRQMGMPTKQLDPWQVNPITDALATSLERVIYTYPVSPSPCKNMSWNTKSAMRGNPKSYHMLTCGSLGHLISVWHLWAKSFIITNQLHTNTMPSTAVFHLQCSKIHFI